MRLGPSARQFQNRDAAVAYLREFGDTIAAVPGVTSRGAVSSLPFTSSVGWGSINVEGWTPQPGQELQVDQRGATTDYFKTMRIPLVQGRFFTDLDMPQNAEPVVIIDEKFAQRFWPNGDAIGKHVWNDPARKLKIVGVVGVVKQYGLDVDGRIVVYRPSPNAGYHVARTSSDPDAVAGAIVRAIQAARSHDDGLRRPDDGGPDERLAGAAAFLDADARRVRGVRADSGGRRRLRRDVAPRGAGRARHRRAHGARRAAQQHRADGAAAGHGADRRRRRPRDRRRAAADARHGQPAVRRQRHRRDDLRRSCHCCSSASRCLASYVPARRATRVDPVVALRDE